MLVSVAGGWYYDDRVTRSQSPVTRITAAVLLGVAVWILAVIHVSVWTRLKGAYGPVQFWQDPDIEAMLSLRFLTLVCVVVGTGVGLLTLGLTIARRRTWRGLVLPVCALSAFAVAYGEFFVHRFYPSA